MERIKSQALRYEGGLSSPHAIPDSSKGWRNFFEAQSLVFDQRDNQVVIKTSEISPQGVMVVHAENQEGKQTGYITDLSLNETEDFFKVVRQTCKSIRDLYPNAPLVMMHIQSTDISLFMQPSDLRKPRLDTTVRNNQSLAGVLHAHCDALMGRWYIFHSVAELRDIHESKFREFENLKPEQKLNSEQQKQIESFVRERRVRLNEGIFRNIALQIWQKEFGPELLNQFSNVFVSNENQNEGQLVETPKIALQLRDGWETLDKPEFAEVTHLLHHTIVNKWQELRDLLNQLKSPSASDQVLERYLNKYKLPYRFKTGIKLTARFLKDREPIPELLLLHRDGKVELSDAELRKLEKSWQECRFKWLHKEFNYVMGVADWQGSNPYLFIQVDPDYCASNVNNIYTSRDQHQLTDNEIALRMEFRFKLMQSLLSTQLDLEVGSEGKYLLSQI